MLGADHPEATTERRMPGRPIARMSAAMLRISESLDFDTVLPKVVDAAHRPRRRRLADRRVGRRRLRQMAALREQFHHR